MSTRFRWLTWALVVSLVLNVVGALRYASTRSTPPPAPPTAEPPPALPLATPIPAPLWQNAVGNTALAGWTPRLRAAGFPEDVIRATIISEIDNRLDKVRLETEAPTARSVEWNPDRLSPQLRDPLASLYRLRRERITAALGPGAAMTPDERRFLIHRFGPLDDDRLEKLNGPQFETSMEDSVPALYNRRHGTSFPESDFLRDANEKRVNALRELLNADEYETYFLRASALASRLRRAFQEFKLTPAEFALITPALRQLHEEQQGYCPLIKVSSAFPEGTETAQRLVEMLQDQLPDTRLKELRHAIITRPPPPSRLPGLGVVPHAQRQAIEEIETQLRQQVSELDDHQARAQALQEAVKRFREILVDPQFQDYMQNRLPLLRLQLQEAP